VPYLVLSKLKPQAEEGPRNFFMLMQATKNCLKSHEIIQLEMLNGFEDNAYPFHSENLLLCKGVETMFIN